MESKIYLWVNVTPPPTHTPAAILGTAVHPGTAAFDKSILEKNPITPDDATKEVVNTLHHPEEDVDWGEDSPQRLEPIAIKLHTDYCENIAPKQRYVAVEAKCKELQLLQGPQYITYGHYRQNMQE